MTPDPLYVLSGALGLLVGGFFIGWCFCREHCDRTHAAERERLQDRIQAQTPGVLGELTSREWTLNEMSATERTNRGRAIEHQEQEGRLAPDPVQEDGEEWERVRETAARGEARFL